LRKETVEPTGTGTARENRMYKIAKNQPLQQYITGNFAKIGGREMKEIGTLLHLSGFQMEEIEDSSRGKLSHQKG